MDNKKQIKKQHIFKNTMKKDMFKSTNMKKIQTSRGLMYLLDIVMIFYFILYIILCYIP